MFPQFNENFVFSKDNKKYHFNEIQLLIHMTLHMMSDFVYKGEIFRNFHL